MAQTSQKESIMNTWIHFSQQSLVLAQSFVAALAMLGMGLEGMTADQDINYVRDPYRPSD
jgi:hypothetical protein